MYLIYLFGSLPIIFDSIRFGFGFARTNYAIFMIWRGINSIHFQFLDTITIDNIMPSTCRNNDNIPCLNFIAIIINGTDTLARFETKKLIIGSKSKRERKHINFFKFKQKLILIFES